jgi:hypothetical protein
MRYMLMMHAGGGQTDYQINRWSADDLRAHVAFMVRLNKDLTHSGELVGAEGLASPREAKLVRAGHDGAPVVTDGPFPESKEFLAGYWIVDVEHPQRAYEIAARASAAPGPSGTPLNLRIELRQVMSEPPADV